MTQEERKYLFLWSRHIEGARALLLRLRDEGVTLFTDTMVKKSEREVYNKAMYDCLLGDKNALDHYMTHDAVGRFYDHVRDKNGRLVSCKFGFFKPQTIYKKL